MAADDDRQHQEVAFLFSMLDRGPNKRRIKPVEKHIIDVPIIADDSEDDEDYHLENDVQNTSNTFTASDVDESDDDSVSPVNNDINVNAVDDDDDDDEDDEDYVESEEPSSTDESNSDSDSDSNSSSSEEENDGSNFSEKKVTANDNEISNKINSAVIRRKPMCLICLNSSSEDSGEIIECDKCGVVVHEGCYGVEDESVLDDDPNESTEPWFCECCLQDNNIRECELCPNRGGVLKQTDTGRWVHSVCALYVTGVTFGDVDSLKPVILSEIPSDKWKSRECHMCEDQRFAKTGVCISCDAGLCKTYFHVTCAQRNGLLLQENGEEEVADPYFAYCKLHCDKEFARKQKRNWLAVQSIIMQTSPNKNFLDNERLQRCYDRARENYSIYRQNLPKPTNNDEFKPRDLSTSASVYRKLLKKTELMGIIPQSNIIDTAIENIKSVRRRWSISPSFTCEFVCYYFERESRVSFLRENIKNLKEKQLELLKSESKHSEQLENLKMRSKMLENQRKSKTKILKQLLQIVNRISDKPFRLPESLQDTLKIENKSNNKDNMMRCKMCGLPDSEYSMAFCDTCGGYYHLACLSPPLTKMPKKTTKFGWQCSDCVKSDDSDCEALMITDVDAPRQTRSNRRPTVIFTPQNSRKPVTSSKKRGWPAGKKRKLLANNQENENIGVSKIIKVEGSPSNDNTDSQIIKVEASKSSNDINCFSNNNAGR